MPKISRKETKLRDEITEKLKKISSEKHVEKAKEKIDSKKHRRRKSRWSTEFDRVLIPGLPVALAGIELTPDQLRIYIMQLKVEEISLKLRTGNLGIPVNPDSRSPSPEPVYNTQGVRLNTREIRVRQKLEEERHVLVRILEEKNSEYRPPPDYKIPANKLTDKVFIPQERYPHINFIGLLIGPRGNTLKRLETDTNCKIIIRGQGSMKEGKSRLAPMPGEDEPLHALITAPSEVALAKGISTIKRIVKDGIDCPDGNNELRQMQLRELAEINGTMLGAEIARCRNCGATDHRHWECTETQNFTNMLTCSRCGGTGHLEIDCIYDGFCLFFFYFREKIVTAAEKAKMDDEYQTLMKELGVNTGETDFFMMPGLPRSLIKDLPWASSANNFLNRGDSTTFTVGPSGPLAISNTPFNPDTIEGGAPYIPGAAPMPSFTVRTLLSQDNTLPSVAMPPLAPWPSFN
uniref:Branchpoint-bridging protein n=1 Tax=Henneguya salminicola TaxID=69463 RepID=A0A6G3MEC1_HENSL